MPRSHARAPSFGTSHTPLPLLRLALLPALLLVTAPLWAAARPRTLSWRHLDIEARLDADGALHVRERHEMLLDGPWNRLERHSRLRLGQGLQLEQLARIDPETGAYRALDRGDPDQGDHYAWVDDSTLRWRCRRPSDPPFDGKVLTYILDYTLTGVLVPTGKGFLLDRDFALPDRRWPIESFSLELTLDPPWRAVQPFPAYLEEHRLPPGRGVGEPRCWRWGCSPASPSRPPRGALLPVAAASGLLDKARSRQSVGLLRRRRHLAAARRYIRRELERPDPDLEDAWWPYLVALDLTRYADRWSRSFGGVATRGGQEVSRAAPGDGWSGGGEAFGGAGGASRWAAAAGALAAALGAGGHAGGGGE